MKIKSFIGFVIFCLVFTFSVQAKIDTNTIVGLWLFDKDGDLSDYSGKGHDGKKDGNVKWVNGKFGMAVSLDGSSFVVVDHKDDMNLQNFTIMGWVNLNSAPTDWWTIACKDGWPNRNYGLWLASGTGLAHSSFTSGAAPDNNFVNAVTPVKAKEWYHVAGTYDMKVSIVYINAVADAKGSFTSKPNVTDVQFTIGRTANGSYKLNGLVDEVALFNKALSETDIKDIYTNGLKATAAAIESKNKLATTWASVKSN